MLLSLNSISSRSYHHSGRQLCGFVVLMPPFVSMLNAALVVLLVTQDNGVVDPGYKCQGSFVGAWALLWDTAPCTQAPGKHLAAVVLRGYI